MNPNHTSFKFPQVQPHNWAKVFRNKAPPAAVDLVSQFLRYVPSSRLDPFDALAHPFFDELREPGARLPNGKPLPNIHNWTEGELRMMHQRGLTKKLIPAHIEKEMREAQERKFDGAGAGAGGSTTTTTTTQLPAASSSAGASAGAGGAGAGGAGAAGAAAPGGPWSGGSSAPTATAAAGSSSSSSSFAPYGTGVGAGAGGAGAGASAPAPAAAPVHQQQQQV